MRRPYSSDNDAISIILALLAGACLVGLFFFRKSVNTVPIFLAGVIFFAGLGSLYKGFKRVRQAQVDQRQINWYKQPDILMGIAMLVTEPYYIIQYLLIPIFPAASASLVMCYDVILAIAVLFVIAAAYFWLRGRWQRRETGEGT